MATVDGLTKARMLAIEAASIVDGTVNGSGHLILTKHDGSTIDAGSVIGPQGPTPPVIDSWPVGSIFINTTSTNPASLLGGGTWVRWGQGRVIVSQDGTDTDFDVAEETGGEKTHVLLVNEMAPHFHSMSHDHANVTFSFKYTNNTTIGGTSIRVNDIDGVTGATGTGGTSNVNVPSFTGNTTSGSSSMFSDPHNNVQPYIVAYMWKRTA